MMILDKVSSYNRIIYKNYLCLWNNHQYKKCKLQWKRIRSLSKVHYIFYIDFHMNLYRTYQDMFLHKLYYSVKARDKTRKYKIDNWYWLHQYTKHNPHDNPYKLYLLENNHHYNLDTGLFKVLRKKSKLDCINHIKIGHFHFLRISNSLQDRFRNMY